MSQLLTFTREGIYCEQGNFHIDPWRKVKRALITHAHADHAGSGHGQYLTHPLSEKIMRHRIGQSINAETVPYFQEVNIQGVKVSFHPAGHVIGSAQIRVEYKGEVWVVSGDYKTEYDGLSTAFEPVKCHTFISECTFGLPIFRWQPQAVVAQKINEWWATNAQNQTASLLFGYSLGKAQRLLQMVDANIGPIYAHVAVHSINEIFRKQGIDLQKCERVSNNIGKSEMRNALIIAPPNAALGNWSKKLQPYSTAFASGWMAIRGFKNRNTADRGFVLSDHADWPGLLQAIKDTEAQQVYVMHGYTTQFAQYLNEANLGLEAIALTSKNDPSPNAEDGDLPTESDLVDIG